MTSNEQNIKKWFSQTSSITDKITGIYTIDDIIEKISTKKSEKNICDDIFEFVFENIIKDLYETQKDKNNNTCLKNAFLKYLMGQCGIFAKFYFLNESETYLQKILTIVQNKESDFSHDTINEIRTLYDDFLKLLLDYNLISFSDYQTYNETYPLFDPMYLSYDSEIKEEILDIAKTIFDY